MVEQAMMLLGKNARFADLCTGSGCIAIALLDLRTDLSAYAIELCEETYLTKAADEIEKALG